MKKIFAIIIMAVLLAACAQMEQPDPVNEPEATFKTYTLTVSASKGSNDGTKALSFDEKTLNATWATSEHVYVQKGSTWATGSLQPQTAGTSTTLKGSLTIAGGISVGDDLTLQFPRSGALDYSGQVGTLADIAAKYDYATATVKVASISDAGNINPEAATTTFTNQQAIVKFTLKASDGTSLINTTQLTVSDGTNIYTVTPASATSEIFVALPGFSDRTVTLNAISGGVRYNYEKTGVTFANNKYYDITVKMTTNGMLPGEFSINAGGGKVNFSMGNLQYRASTGTWRFAPNQYDMIGSDNAYISDSYAGWIDLLGWGTGNAPTKSSTNNNDYSTFTDWGINAISNGGNTTNMWSTLTKDEWAYIFDHHTKGWSTVNGVNGYVIRPDGVSTAVAASYTAAEWATEEAAGSVFLPAGGSRGGTTFNTGFGDYWSSTSSNSNDAYYLYFHSGGQNPSQSAGRFGGRAVRLVYETPYFQGAGTEESPYLISSEAAWNYLANKVNSGTSYEGKFFRQTANINVTTMVGDSNDSKTFSGTYDGDGKTLNLNLNTATPHTAPFRFIENATIKNVVTTGTVYSTGNHPSGLVGITHGTCTIQNCRVSANVGGSSHLGGIVGHCHTAASISIIGCVYTGTLSPTNGFTGGILGWGGDGGGHTLSISNCLFAGTLTGSTSFHPVGIVQNTNNTRTVSNTYYTLAHNLNNEDTHGNSFVKDLSYKGKFARSITAGSDVTVANAGAATVYNVSGITSYGTGILYDGVLYAGDGEAINLTLSHGAAPTGFSFNQYTVTGGGTLANPTTNTPTLTMTDANQRINVDWTFTQTFNYTGAVQTFTVPATGYYTLECYGAQGGTFTSNRGGYGGTSQLTYLLTQGTTLYIYVGGQGGSIAESKGLPDGGNGGWNGGGKGGTGVKWHHEESETPWSGGGGGGGATHIATSAIGPITKSTDFTSNHTNLLLIAGGGGGGCSKGEGGNAGGATGEKGFHIEAYWNIAWNNGTYSCGKDGMLSSWEDHSCEGCGGGGGGYVGGNTWVVQYNEPHQCYSGAGGSSWGETTNGKGYTTTSGGATAGGNGKAVITWYGTSYSTE